MTYQYTSPLWLFSVVLILTACGSKGGKTNVDPIITSTQPKEIVDNNAQADYKVIIYGNSHTNQLGSLIEHIIENQYPNKSVQTTTVSDTFLDDIVANSANVKKLESESWSHTIIQGQKYSQSGITNYPTDAAERLIYTAKMHSITPILFPEHPQRGNTLEGKRVYELYLAISAKQPSCIAPIGLVWDRLLELMPSAKLHLNDGNHASYAGKILTAMTFSEVITSEPADTMVFDPSINLTQQEQALFGQVVTETLELYPACPAN